MKTMPWSSCDVPLGARGSVLKVTEHLGQGQGIRLVVEPLVVEEDVVDVDPLLGAGVVGAVGEVAAGGEADAGPVVEAERG